MFSEEFLPYGKFSEEFLLDHDIKKWDWETTTNEEIRIYKIWNHCKDIAIKGNQVFFILNNSEIV